MSEAAAKAFATAKEIRILLGELIEQLNELGADESLTTQQRHMTIRQICDYTAERNGVIENYAKNYLDTHVEKCSKMEVPGVSLGDGVHYVAGMVYAYRPVHKVEILNKDDRSWEQLLTALIQAGGAAAIQKRLTPSYFVGVGGERLLEAVGGMIGCSTDGQWSITKPKPQKS
jgi:hypothetical protein